MIPKGYVCLRRSHSDAFLGNWNACKIIYMKPYKRQCNSLSLTMGPVVASLAMYATHRILQRLVAGQLFRKGIPRKIRRLVSMMMEYEVLADVFSEFMEELMTVLTNTV